VLATKKVIACFFFLRKKNFFFNFCVALAYNVYDKPLFAGSAATAVYHHKKSQDDESFGSEADMEKLRSTDRFQPDKGFSGADKGQKRAGPVEFEKEEDPFGIDQFLNEAKKGKRSTEDAAQGGSDSKRSRH